MSEARVLADGEALVVRPLHAAAVHDGVRSWWSLKCLPATGAVPLRYVLPENAAAALLAAHWKHIRTARGDELFRPPHGVPTWVFRRTGEHLSLAPATSAAP